MCQEMCERICTEKNAQITNPEKWIIQMRQEKDIKKTKYKEIICPYI